MTNTLLRFFEMHGLKLATALFVVILAQAGVFGQVTQSAAGMIALVLVFAMAAVLIAQFVKAEPIMRDALTRRSK